jgi:hypothetical protein
MGAHTGSKHLIPTRNRCIPETLFGPELRPVTYEFEGYDKDTNPLSYKLTNMYVISTRPFRFAPGTGTTKEMESRNNSASAAGSLKASAEDLTKSMVATDGLPNHPDILDAHTISQMETRPFPDIAPGRAHGWQVHGQNQNDCSENRRLWHNGASDGGTSFMAKYENYSINGTVVDDINVAIVANRPGADTGRLQRLAKDIALEVANSVILDAYDLFEPLGLVPEVGPLDDGTFKIYLPLTISE